MLVDSEEILKSYAVRLKVASLRAIDIASHLSARQAEEHARILFEVAVHLDKLNQAVRQVAEEYE